MLKLGSSLLSFVIVIFLLGDCSETIPKRTLDEYGAFENEEVEIAIESNLDSINLFIGNPRGAVWID